MNEPLDRRSHELKDFDKRLTVVEAKQSDTDKMVSGINYALFGLPQDHTNNGMVGTMSEMKESIERVKGTLSKILVAVIIGIGIDGAARVILHQ